ncbi:MAG: hypothetical protein JNM69_23180 [Archangium sp.]|nr:hypothetical protein [Archangium sp.]
MHRFALLALLCSCAPSSMTPEGPPRFVGKVSGTDALIGLAVEDGSVVAYVCGKDSWETRTGWFATGFESAEAVEEGALVSVSSASGHTLENAVVERSQVTGSIRFADGTVAPFVAERADPRTAAGLYDTTSSEGQAGLIITNDLEAAGAATAISGTDVAPTRAQVQVVGTLVGTPSPPTVTVSVPNLSVTTLTPVVPAQQSVTATSPTLVILVHGMSHPVDSQLRLVDTPEYSRGEWSVDFLRGLLGAAPNTAPPLFSFLRPFSDAEYLTVGAPFPSTLTDATVTSNAGLPANFVTAVPVDVTPAPLGQTPRIPRPPPISAFITYRDSGAGLVESGQRIANQAYLALRWYEQTFKKTPRLVFVTQSFGGVTSRFVLSAPLTAELTNARVPFDGVTLTAEDLRRMIYVRDRTMSLVTLGTPHEGSFLADVGVPAQMALQDVATGLENQVAPNSEAGRFGASLRIAANIFPDLTDEAVTTNAALTAAREGLAEVQRRLNGRALRDLQHPFWERVNQGPLHPRRARRATSPILNASNQLIPVYAGGSRSPGGRAFTGPELSAFTRFGAESPKEQTWIMMTMFADFVIRAARLQGFGSSTTTLLADFDGQLDRRRRLSDFGAFARERLQAVVGSLSPWALDSTQTTTALDGAIALAFGQGSRVTIPVTLDQEGRFELTGRVRAPALGFSCTDGSSTFRIVMDFGRLLTSLVQTYTNLGNARARAGALDLNGLISALGLAAANIDDIKDWFVTKYAALTVPDGRCKLPDANPLNLLSLANLGNWRTVVADDVFPSPVWVRTGAVAQDDEIDTDGPVAFDSAMGLTLGTQTPLFFDHARRDDVRNGVPSGGSWYRFFDSPIEADCHGMQHQFIAGQWVVQTFVPAGPVPRAMGLGSF